MTTLSMGMSGDFKIAIKSGSTAVRVGTAIFGPRSQVLDLKNWLNPRHYDRLWNVGPPGLVFSVFLIYIVREVELLFNMKTYELSAPWFYVLFVLVLGEAIFILFWVLFSLPPKNRGKGLAKEGVYALMRHPIYTTIIFLLNILLFSFQKLLR